MTCCRIPNIPESFFFLPCEVVSPSGQVRAHQLKCACQLYPGRTVQIVPSRKHCVLVPWNYKFQTCWGIFSTAMISWLMSSTSCYSLTLFVCFLFSFFFLLWVEGWLRLLWPMNTWEEVWTFPSRCHKEARGVWRCWKTPPYTQFHFCCCCQSLSCQTGLVRDWGGFVCSHECPAAPEAYHWDMTSLEFSSVFNCFFPNVDKIALCCQLQVY